MSGNCAIGRRLMATRPAIVMRIAMTIATIGRLIKNCAILLSSRFRGGWGRCCSRRRRGRSSLGLRFSWDELGIDDHPVPDLLQSFADDTFIRFEPFLDNPQVTDAFPSFHRPQRHFVVWAHHGKTISALQLLHGALWHEQGIFLRLSYRSDFCVQSRTKHVVGIREIAYDS